VASVVQMLHMIMHHGGLLRRRVFDELMMLACYIAAAIHDYEHGGVNNDFLIQTRDRLAVTYNDISPLENHHLAAAARLMSEPKYRFTDVGLARPLAGLSCNHHHHHQLHAETAISMHVQPRHAHVPLDFSQC